YPLARGWTVQILEEERIIRTTQDGFHLRRIGLGHGQGPLRWHTSMEQRYAEGSVVVQQGSVTQPREEVVTVGGCEHIRKGILRLAAYLTVLDGQEMEIVIAQYRDSTVPQCLDK